MMELREVGCVQVPGVDEFKILNCAIELPDGWDFQTTIQAGDPIPENALFVLEVSPEGKTRVSRVNLRNLVIRPKRESWT